jgi:tellurite resistance protein TerC
MGLQKDREIHPDQNPVLRLARKLVPVTDRFEGGKFFVRREGKTFATPLFLVLLVVETTDLIFAVDSIPAVMAITQVRFIIYTSNVFAIMGPGACTRTKGAMDLFHHLHYGLALILVRRSKDDGQPRCASPSIGVALAWWVEALPCRYSPR